MRWVVMELVFILGRLFFFYYGLGRSISIAGEHGGDCYLECILPNIFIGFRPVPFASNLALDLSGVI